MGLLSEYYLYSIDTLSIYDDLDTVYFAALILATNSNNFTINYTLLICVNSLYRTFEDSIDLINLVY